MVAAPPVPVLSISFCPFQGAVQQLLWQSDSQVSAHFCLQCCSFYDGLIVKHTAEAHSMLKPGSNEVDRSVGTCVLRWKD